MWATNLKILAVVLGTIGLYTLIANSIPQVESEVPQALTLSGDVTVDQIISAGEGIFTGAGGCTACHGLGTRAPNLRTDEAGLGPIGARCGQRKSGMACRDYLFESLTQPGAYVVEGYQPIMPDMRKILSPAQILTVIAYLQSQGGAVTITPEEVKDAQADAGAGSGPAGGAAAQASSATLDPKEIIKQNNCLACHQLGGEGATIAPSFDGLGGRATADYIRRSILEPNADTAKGYEAVAGVMPTTFGQQLSAAQLEALVHFLASQK